MKTTNDTLKKYFINEYINFEAIKKDINYNENDKQSKKEYYLLILEVAKLAPKGWYDQLKIKSIKKEEELFLRILKNKPSKFLMSTQGNIFFDEEKRELTHLLTDKIYKFDLASDTYLINIKEIK